MANYLTKKEQIRNILLLLLAALVTAGIFAIYMIQKYGPTGIYIAENVIISPYALQSSDQKGSKIAFQGFVFSYFENNEQKISHPKREQYIKFYDTIEKDESIKKEQLDKDFSAKSISKLTILLTSKTGVDIVETLEFIENDYYRARINNSSGEWIYFFHPNIYNKVTNIFKE